MNDVPAWLHRLRDTAASVLPAELSKYTPPDDGSGRPAAVLILFGEGPEGPDLLLMQRSDDLRAHAGQPAFPGGAVDPDDAGPVAAALREAEEETGLDPAGVDVIAQLPTLHLPVSDYIVTPVIGWWRAPTAVAAVDPNETAHVARIPVAELVDPVNRMRVRHPSGYIGPAFRARGMIVWGFTGGLLDRVLELGGWARPWSQDVVEELPQDRLDLSRRTAPPGHGR